VQQNNVHDNRRGGILAGDNCLITGNTANSNGEFGGIAPGARCTISFNTANNNTSPGILASAFGSGSGALITGNVALNNNLQGARLDYAIRCPSTVTFNESTNGYPVSYGFIGNGCKANDNE
jgi:hypothetical protein